MWSRTGRQPFTTHLTYFHYYRLEKAEKEEKEESSGLVSPRDILNQDPEELGFSSQLEESIDSWRAESAPTVELEPLLPSTVLPSSSTWLLRFLSLLVTPLRISRWRESHQDIFNLPSEETKSSTPWSKLPSLAVVSFLTFTRLWSWNQPRKQRCERIEIQQQMHEKSLKILIKWTLAVDCAVPFLQCMIPFDGQESSKDHILQKLKDQNKPYIHFVCYIAILMYICLT